MRTTTRNTLVAILALSCLLTACRISSHNQKPEPAIAKIEITYHGDLDSGTVVLRNSHKDPGENGGVYEQRIKLPKSSGMPPTSKVTINNPGIPTESLRIYLIAYRDDWLEPITWGDFGRKTKLVSIDFRSTGHVEWANFNGGKDYPPDGASSAMGSSIPMRVNLERLMHMGGNKERHEFDADPSLIRIYNDNPAFKGKTLVLKDAERKAFAREPVPMKSWVLIESKGNLRGGYLEIVDGNRVISKFHLICTGTEAYQVNFAIQGSTLRVSGDDAEIPDELGK